MECAAKEGGEKVGSNNVYSHGGGSTFWRGDSKIRHCAILNYMGEGRKGSEWPGIFQSISIRLKMYIFSLSRFCLLGIRK